MPFSEFVTISPDARLYRRGAPYRFLGTNMWYAMHLGASDPPRLLRELDRLRALGVRNVRALAASEGPDSESWFAREREHVMPGLSDLFSLGQQPTPWRVVPSLQPSPGEYNDAVLRGLDTFVSAVAQRNMTCVLMLGNMWPWSGGFAQYVAWSEGSPIPYMPPEPGGDWDRFQRYAAKFYADADAQAAFLSHTRMMLTRTNALTGVRYADEPAIMGWQLANEPRPMRQVGAFRRWLDSSTGLIRSLAPLQLISIGSEGRT